MPIFRLNFLSSFPFSVINQLTIRDINHPVDRADQRGFASTGKTDDGNEFSLLDGEIHMLEPFGPIRVGLRYISELYTHEVIPLFNGYIVIEDWPVESINQ